MEQELIGYVDSPMESSEDCVIHNLRNLHRGWRASQNPVLKGKLTMETSQLIQAAASIASAMAASRYGKFGGMEESRIVDIAAIAVKIARAIEAEAIKQA